MQEADLYKKLSGDKVECFLCRHNCKIKNGDLGICAVRENRGGTLYSIFYGKPCSTAVDPIEKKPLFHFYPGTRSFSVATLGCNFQCEFCQNWEISQYGRIRRLTTDDQRLQEISPEQIVSLAIENNCKTISYTYSEPTIFYEYARDIAKIAKPGGIENVFVTNGYMSREMLDDARPWLAAANVDLKAFKETTYRKVMKGSLKGVLDSIAHMKKLEIWIEITTLIVPKMNDDEKELADIASFIASVGDDIPWHISRFHPQYKMQDSSPTPAEIMQRAYEIGKNAGLKYVYLGSDSTYCWKCNERLISRHGFSIRENKIKDSGICPKCSSRISGIF